MTVRYERAFAYDDRTIWTVYPAPSRLYVGIKRFIDEPGLSAPSRACRREIRDHFAWAAGVFAGRQTDARNVRIVPY